MEWMVFDDLLNILVIVLLMGLGVGVFLFVAFLYLTLLEMMETFYFGGSDD